MSAVEGYIPVNGSAGNSSPFAGGRRRSHKKLRMVKKSTVRRMLKSKGLKMRGGGDAPSSGPEPPKMGGRRHRKSRGRSTRRRRSLFGMKY